MENPKKGHFNDHLRERTISLSIRVYNLVQDKRLTVLVRPIVNQVIRSSSSVAANYRAATRARSDNEFYAKICIVVGECDEKMFWVEYLVRTGLLTREETAEIQKENEALLRIFTTTKKTMKDKLRL